MGEASNNKMKTFISAIIERFRLNVLFIWALGLITGLAFLYSYHCYQILAVSEKVVLDLK